MKKFFSILAIVLITNLLFTACSSSSKTAAPVKAVEDYLKTLVAKDDNRLPTLVCGSWEEDAMIALDSFQAVTPKLENVACAQSGIDGSTVLVKCTGNIVMTYNNEDQRLDLSTLTYQVVQQNGDWLVCGTR